MFGPCDICPLDLSGEKLQFCQKHFGNAAVCNHDIHKNLRLIASDIASDNTNSGEVVMS